MGLNPQNILLFRFIQFRRLEEGAEFGNFMRTLLKERRMQNKNIMFNVVDRNPESGFIGGSESSLIVNRDGENGFAVNSLVDTGSPLNRDGVPWIRVITQRDSLEFSYVAPVNVRIPDCLTCLNGLISCLDVLH